MCSLLVPCPCAFVNNTTSRFVLFPKTTLQTIVVSSIQLHSYRRLRPHPIPCDASSTKHRTRLVETFHEHQKLKSLIRRLKKEDSNPLHVLKEDEDWSKDQFWLVIKFLRNASRSKEILLVFKHWKSIEESRSNVYNYEKVIEILGAEGLIEEAVLAFQEMKSVNLTPSLEIYKFIVHGYAKKGNFDDAFRFLDEAKEMKLALDADMYNGLIEAYGRREMYDEIGMCLKKMGLEGCKSDESTYNILMQEFSRGGLIKRMEKVYQAMLSKRIDFRPFTLLAMLDAYAKFGIVKRMEKVYRKIVSSEIPLKEDLIRKLAVVYTENYMFSRLEDLAFDLSSGTGETDLVWCLRLLSHACLLSRRGLESVVQDMDERRVPWNATVANIILLTYLKMKNFTHLRILLSELPSRRVEPDIITCGIIYDATCIGFDGSGIWKAWESIGYMHMAVEMNTDPLVLAAFGKGYFLRNVEELFSLVPEARKKKVWSYRNLIDFVSKHKLQSSMMGSAKNDGSSDPLLR